MWDLILERGFVKALERTNIGDVLVESIVSVIFYLIFGGFLVA